MGRKPETAPEPAVRRGIQTRLAVLVLVAALAPVVLLGSASFGSLAIMREALSREREALVASEGRQVERRLREMLESLAAVPARPEGSAWLRPAQRDALRVARLRSRLLAGAVLVNAAGAVVETSGISDPDALAAVTATGSVRDAIVSGLPVVCPAEGPDATLHLAVVPLRGASGRIVAAAVGLIDTRTAAWTALAPPLDAGTSARLRLVDERDRVLAGAEARPGRGQEVVLEAHLTVLPWRLVLSQPEREVFAPVKKLQRKLAVLTPVLAGVAGLFAWGVARSVKRPLAQLERAAARIASGDLVRPVPPLGDDEIGRLGRSFEGMRVALARDEVRKRLLRKVITAQEEERKRLARELHDEICQTITALKMKVAGYPEAQAMADRGLDELHRIIHDLRPSILDDLGLLAAIRWVAKRNLEPHGIQVRCEFDDLPPHLPAEIEIAVFRAVQEAVSNVVRHAEADKVLIEISASDQVLEVDVEDDGRGFVPAAVAGVPDSGRGLGILGMRERMELIGGTVDVTSSPGAGTRVALRVPIPAEV